MGGSLGPAMRGAGRRAWLYAWAMASSIVLISVGNTRTRFAASDGKELEPSQVWHNAEHDALVKAVIGALNGSDAGPRALIASVNPAAADRLETALEAGGLDVVRFGRDLPIPMPLALKDASTVGQDRLLDALGAYARSSQACIVIDAGTAVTVDFVDGEGVFQGGAIAPGLRMMLRSLNEQTAALPLVSLGTEDEPTPAPPGADGETPSPFGKSTREAMLAGVHAAARGVVHQLIDRYAEFYGAYPRVVATGGDAPRLFQNDDLIEHIVPDLTLVGMLEAVKRLEALDEDAETATERDGVED